MRDALFLKEEAPNKSGIDLCQQSAHEKVKAVRSQHLPKYTGSAKNLLDSLK